MRDENEDVREQLAQMTQMYMRVKAENEALKDRQQMKGDEHRLIEQKVKRIVVQTEKMNMAKIAE